MVFTKQGLTANYVNNFDIILYLCLPMCCVFINGNHWLVQHTLSVAWCIKYCVTKNKLNFYEMGEERHLSKKYPDIEMHN